MQVMESERMKATRERIGGLVSRMKQPPGITEDMYRPLLFPNHQVHFKIFNVLVCLGEGRGRGIPLATPTSMLPVMLHRPRILLCVRPRFWSEKARFLMGKR